MDLEKALRLLSLPRPIGPHPEDGEPVEAGIGRYGPYVRHGRTYANLPDVDEVWEVGMNRAVELIAAKRTRGRPAAAEPLRGLGEHPESGGEMAVMEGRYGPYVKWGKVNATLPKGTDPADVTPEMAVELIAAKQAKGKKGGRSSAKSGGTKSGGSKSAGKTSGAKSTSAKGAAKGATTKTSPAKKTSSRKTSAKASTGSKGSGKTAAE
jgi:DNA topoisomerase-1